MVGGLCDEIGPYVVVLLVVIVGLDDVVGRCVVV